MSDVVKIIECPRDAWQGLPKNMPAEVKADYLRVLIAAGFKHIDAVSFVSRAAVPQMADSELVLEYLDPPDDVEIIGIVVNAKGAERAVKTGSVQTLGFPYSISQEFLKRNQNQTPEESLEELEKVGTLAYKAGMDVVAYISMAFGNPYGEAWDIEEVVAACDLLADNGVTQISLADTVGSATPELIHKVVDAVLRRGLPCELGIHMHSTRAAAAAKVVAAYDAGCRRFDSAIGGLGGCPFAQDDLVGNIPTEEVVAALAERGVSVPALDALAPVLEMNDKIGREFATC